jgi:hypothetical protein
MRVTIPIAEQEPTPWPSFRRDRNGETIMSTATHIDRVGTSAVALRLGKFRRTATRMVASIGDVALVVIALFWWSTVSTISAVKASALSRSGFR